MVDFAEDTSTELKRKVRALRMVAAIETVSYGILLLAMLAHSVVAIKLTGAMHGWVFIAFVVMVLGVARPMGWHWWTVVIAIFTGPLGAVLVYHWCEPEKVPALVGRAADPLPAFARNRMP
jgi:integral membrane protein